MVKFHTNTAFYLFKTIGLAPIDFKTSWSTKNQSFSWLFTHSLIGLLYNIFLISTVVTANIFGIKYSYGEFKSKNALDAFIGVNFDILVSANSVFVLISFTSQGGRMIDFGNKINQARELAMFIDKKLYDCKNTSFNDLSFISLIYVSTLIGLTVYKSNEEVLMIIYYFIIVVDILIVAFTLLQYCVVVKSTKKLLMFINENLMQVLERPLKTLESQEDEHDICLKIKLNNLIRLHDLTCKISQKASKFYSFPVFWSVLVHFMVLIYSSYFILKDHLFSTGDNSLENSIIADLVTLILNIPSIIMAAIYVSSTEEEVNYLLRLIHVNMSK